MNLISPSTYSSALSSICRLRHLRKVKLFPRVSTVTVVTYSIDKALPQKFSADQRHYIGRARTINLKNLRTMTIELEHNSHLPPPRNESEEPANDEDIEIEPSPRIPAIGFNTLPA